MKKPVHISIIIPTLNEERYILKTIRHTLEMAAQPDNMEIVVVDAGSTDNTLKRIPKECQIIQDHSLRGHKPASLNLGVEESQGDIILLLDADTELPQNFDKKILTVLQNHEVVGGAFNMRFHRTTWQLKILQLVNQARYLIEREFYSDQAIFCKRETLKNIGGVPDVNIMEAALLSKKLRRIGKMVLLKDYVITSSRRFDENGFWKTFWMDFRIWLRFRVGLKSQNLGKKYWKFNQALD